jgi:hypothetical protein
VKEKDEAGREKNCEQRARFERTIHKKSIVL